MSTAIEWSEETWNPVTGCTKVSPGCDHCYAERITNRWKGPGAFDKIVLHGDRLPQPFHWKKPRTVFVNSMSDLFHDDIPTHFIHDVFATMAATPRHTYQILTKRPGRMASLVRSMDTPEWRCDYSLDASWPLPNVWLGTSVEDQKWAEVRVPKLLDTPAAVRFLSCEPLLGPLNLARWLDYDHDPNWCGDEDHCSELLSDREPLDWVIVGGESGPGFRSVVPAWVRSLRDQCVEASVAFFFKQWGGHTPKAGGRELDGRLWDEMPQKKGSAHE